jgi:hypothetical protein
MTKRIVVGLLSFCTTMWLLYTCIGSPAEVAREVTEVIPLTIVTDNGECWVVDKNDRGLVKESLFHALDLDECINWIRNNETS